jgi:hypothetical protein
MRRWCTRQTKSEMGSKPICYAMTGWRRTESGRPVANIRFRTAAPMAACQSARKRDPRSASKRDPFRCGLYEAAMFLCLAGGRFFAPA